jgi:hypothetical protein
MRRVHGVGWPFDLQWVKEAIIGGWGMLFSGASGRMWRRGANMCWIAFRRRSEAEESRTPISVSLKQLRLAEPN